MYTMMPKINENNWAFHRFSLFCLSLFAFLLNIFCRKIIYFPAITNAKQFSIFNVEIYKHQIIRYEIRSICLHADNFESEFRSTLLSDVVLMHSSIIYRFWMSLLVAQFVVCKQQDSYCYYSKFKSQKSQQQSKREKR